MHARNWTNEEWQQLIKASDENAWEVLYQELAVWIGTYTHHKLAWMSKGKQKEFRDNCQQAAAERIWMQIDNYSGMGAFLGWCRTVTIRVAIDQVRLERSERQVAPVNVTEESAEFIGSADDAEAVENALVWEQLRSCIDQGIATVLTANERRVIVAGPDASVQTLAEQLSMTSNSIHQFRFQARKKLRHYLEEQRFTREQLRQWGIL